MNNARSNAARSKVSHSKVARTIAGCALLALTLTACGQDKAAAQEETSVISSVTAKAVAEARKEIHEGNITISNHGNGRDLPKAEITPKGDLLIEGKAVAINAQQRALLLQYRSHVASVAEAGVEIGMQGADVATQAVGAAFKGIFSGKSEEEIEKSVEAQTSKLKASAAKLCERLPAMRATQQQLAAALPEFKPYASMSESDVEDCLRDVNEGTQEMATETASAAKEAAAAAGEAADAAKDAARAAQDAASAAEEAANAVSN